MPTQNCIKTMVPIMIIAMLAVAGCSSNSKSHRGKEQGLPPEAIKACEGKQEGDSVTFSGRGGASLKATEFIRRYLLHILPRGFMKISYFGFLGHANKKMSIPLIRLLINPEAEIAVKLFV